MYPGPGRARTDDRGVAIVTGFIPPPRRRAAFLGYPDITYLRAQHGRRAAPRASRRKDRRERPSRGSLSVACVKALASQFASAQMSSPDEASAHCWRALLEEGALLELARYGAPRGFFDDTSFLALIDGKEYKAAAEWLAECYGLGLGGSNDDAQFDKVYGGLLDHAFFAAVHVASDPAASIDPHRSLMHDIHTLKRKHLVTMPQEGKQQVMNDWQLVVRGRHQPEAVLDPPMPPEELKQLAASLSKPRLAEARSRAAAAAALEAGKHGDRLHESRAIAESTIGEREAAAVTVTHVCLRRRERARTVL